ncbi:MAG: EAL domain-containing protein [Campylobacterales bacterium]|nr:EAL domain-containing protein [Campylobacterales bacterium]
MTEFVQVARQPIIDAANATYGYELLHREGENNAANPALTHRLMSAQVMLSVFNLIGRERAVGDDLAFFNISPTFLMTDIIEAFRPDQCVFEIAANEPLRYNEIAKLKLLFNKGYRFALDNFVVTASSIAQFQSVLPYITYLKMDIQNNDIEQVTEHVAALKANHKLIAQKVESIDEFSAYQGLGFDYFQGYYIQHPVPVKHYRLEPKHIGVSRLYKMLDTVPFYEFAKEFERHNELTIQFFQYLISTGMKRYDATRSVRAMIMDIGPDVMRRWFMLIIYAKGGADISAEKGPFSRFFAERIDLMNTIVSNVHSADPERRSDELRLLAIFSTLIDIYQIPFDTLMGSFEITKNLEKWIAARKGRFSLLYKAVNQLQHPPLDIEKVNRLLKAFKTDYDEVSVKMNHRV